MGSLLFRCPNTDREIDGGICIDWRSLSLDPFFTLRRHCPACGDVHHWHAMEGRIDPAGPEGKERRSDGRSDETVLQGDLGPQPGPAVGFLDHVALRMAVASTQQRSRQLRLRAAERIGSLQAVGMEAARIVGELQGKPSDALSSGHEAPRASEQPAATGVSPERRELADELVALLTQVGVDCELWIGGLPVGSKTWH